MARPHDSDLCDVADTVAELVITSLGQSVIPSSIPAEIGEWIRQAAGHGASYWSNVIPMVGASGMITNWVLNPDGTMQLELRDTNGRTFWRGTFRPVPDA